MKTIFIILFAVLFFPKLLVSQIVIVKNDTIPVAGDSIAKLILPKYRGEAVWQQSINQKYWVTLNRPWSDTLIIPADMESTYRAKIVDGNCNPIYSDTIAIVYPDSTKAIIPDSVYFLLHPLNEGELIDFVIEGDTFTFIKEDSLYFFEGDIVLSERQIGISQQKGASISGIARRWPFKEVPYSISIFFTKEMKDKIKLGINYWNTKTSLNFIERTDEESYIRFVPDLSKCYSFVGMIQDQPQPIHLASWAWVGAVIHEIGHAVGLIHEQSRSDRDNYVKIIEDNIIFSALNNFEKRKATISIDNFDFKSLMLYHPYSFAIDKTKPTITKLDGSLYSGERNHLSAKDIAMVEHFYNEMSGFFVDERDKNIYKWIKMGEQYWMAENLVYLPENPGPVGCVSNIESENTYTEKYYSVIDDFGIASTGSTNYTEYGVLYNWPAAKSDCPKGWHLPNETEWAQMEGFIEAQTGGEMVISGEHSSYITNIGKFLKSKFRWYNEGNGNDYYEFDGRPGGVRAGCDSFSGLTSSAYWWTATEISEKNAYYKRLFYENANFYTQTLRKDFMLSVRCIKD